MRDYFGISFCFFFFYTHPNIMQRLLIMAYLAVNSNFCLFLFYFSDLNISENTTFVVHDGPSSGAQLLAKFERNSSLLESSRTITSTQPWVYARWTGEAEGWNRVEVVFTEASKPGKLVILIWRHIGPHSLNIYCISCYFREGFIFASQTFAKISTSIHVYL